MRVPPARAHGNAELEIEADRVFADTPSGWLTRLRAPTGAVPATIYFNQICTDPAEPGPRRWFATTSEGTRPAD